MGATMNYFSKQESSPNPYGIYKPEDYEIPMHELMLMKKHSTEAINYALYCEEKSIYLLTNISIVGEFISGSGNYVKPYCQLDEIGSYTLSQLDKDAYNWFMTQAR